MCAIFGTIGRANLDLIKEISKKQIYRGPNEQNYFVSKDNLVSIGNNRLAVIDKANGNQPMFSNNKRYVSVFNGCIYNFNEIKRYLESKKVTFKTKSDTEVLVNSFEYFGFESFNYFDGMWAVAIYDQELNKIILSRDYVGQKPLYYSKNNEYYVFSSQLEGLLVDKSLKIDLSKESLKKFFTYSHVPAPNTLFSNIYQVEPGENIIIDVKNLEKTNKKYWDLTKGPDHNIFFKPIQKSNFEEEFSNIIKQHSIADKDPAISLSGGVDSYLVMNYFSSNKDSTTSYTLGFQNETFDESKHVKKINKKIEKKIFNLTDEEIKEQFINITKLLTEPMGDSSIIPTYIIQNKIKEFSNVSLGGDGGDESFFGYITFDAYYLAIKIKKIFPNFVFNIIKKITNLYKVSENYISTSTKLRRFFNSLHLDNKYLLPNWMGGLNKDDLNLLFDAKFSYIDIYKDLDFIFKKSDKSMRSAQLYYFKFYLPLILMKIDQASMLNSVESRSPFLSKKIINFSLAQSINHIYKFMNKKYYLTKQFKNVLPKDVLRRKKHGFAFPKENILKDQKLMNNLIDRNILINPDFFDGKYKKFLEKSEDCSQYIWNELILNITLQNLKKTRSF
tara:strand:+ start:5504 stop:7351 length:1848 start_codon:yes stop_codon:yes gene_type:complete